MSISVKGTDSRDIIFLIHTHHWLWPMRKMILLMSVSSSRLGAMPNRLIALLNDELSRYLTWRGLRLTHEP